MTPAKRPIIVGIAGGTASGKTSVARRLQEGVGTQRSVLLELDAYYRDLSGMSLEERHRVDFDHPSAFDFDLLLVQLQALLRGESVEVPVYDYVRHNRREESIPVEARPLILIEGILVLWHRAVRDILDIKVFVDTPDDLRLLRRIQRDTLERGRALDSILRQYENTVRPAHLEFCEPTKVFADVIVPRGGENTVAIDMVASLLVARFA